jgi:hypothetical protein
MQSNSNDVFGPWWIWPTLWCVCASVLVIANVVA